MGARTLLLTAWAFSLGLSTESGDRLTVLSGPSVERALRPSSGRPLLVHLWASWCQPCVGEWPAVADWLRRLPARRLDVLTLSVDEAESVAAARAVLARLGRLPGRHVAASLDDALAPIHALDPDWDGSLPATLLVDAAGKLVLAQHGLTRFEPIDEAIARLGPPVPAGAAARDHPVR